MKCITSVKGRLPKSIFGDFWWFWGSPGEGKNDQKSKKCLPKIDRKKGGKKGGDLIRCWSSAAAFARPVGMQDSCSGRFLPWFLGAVYSRHHSRRSAADWVRWREDRRTPLNSCRWYMWKIGNNGLSKIDVFFGPFLEPTFPHFRVPQAPKK